MNFDLIHSNSAGEFVGAVIFAFAAIDTIIAAIFDPARRGSIQGFGGVN